MADDTLSRSSSQSSVGYSWDTGKPVFRTADDAMAYETRQRLQRPRLKFGQSGGRGSAAAAGSDVCVTPYNPRPDPDAKRRRALNALLSAREKTCEKLGVPHRLVVDRDSGYILPRDAVVPTALPAGQRPWDEDDGGSPSRGGAVDGGGGRQGFSPSLAARDGRTSTASGSVGRATRPDSALRHERGSDRGSLLNAPLVPSVVGASAVGGGDGSKLSAAAESTRLADRAIEEVSRLPTVEERREKHYQRSLEVLEWIRERRVMSALDF